MSTLLGLAQVSDPGQLFMREAGERKFPSQISHSKCVHTYSDMAGVLWLGWPGLREKAESGVESWMTEWWRLPNPAQGDLSRDAKVPFGSTCPPAQSLPPSIILLFIQYLASVISFVILTTTLLRQVHCLYPNERN